MKQPGNKIISLMVKGKANATYAALLRAEKIISRIKALHFEDEGYCAGCCVPEYDDYVSGLAVPAPWPCATIRALEGA